MARCMFVSKFLGSSPTLRRQFSTSICLGGRAEEESRAANATLLIQVSSSAVI